MTSKLFKNQHFMAVLTLGMGLLLAGTGSAALGQRVLLDKVIAIVDDDVVLQSELDARTKDIRESALRNNTELPESEEFLAEVLEALVLENIQMQFAERVGIRFDDDTINRILGNMAETNDMSFEEYLEVLENAGVYLQTREQVRQQMTMQELQRGAVNNRISITDQEIENFLNSEMGREVMATDYLIDHILIPSSSSDSPAERSAKLRFSAELVARINDGQRFADARAAAIQAGVYTIEGTEFGYRKADQLPGIFSTIVTEMSVDDVEGPIEAGNGFHIILLADKQGGTDQLVNQTNIRHIMLTPNEIRNEAQTKTEIEKFRQQIVDGEDFATLARQNSDDASSVVGGGDLDWVNEGGMPVEMQVVIDSLDVDELSQPFETATGWHIAQVLGRRVSDLSGEYSRQQAENALRNRKFDLELQNWLIEIREEAFVELVN